MTYKTIDPATASPLVWFLHARDRENFWAEQKQDELGRDMVAEWKRQKMIAYGRMTQAERDSLPRG